MMLSLVFCKRLVLIFVVGLGVWELGGCSASEAPRLADPNYCHPELVDHAILVNENGLPCDPVSFAAYSTLEHPAAYEAQLEKMFVPMGHFFDQHDPSKLKARRILIFIHGGMNDPSASRNTASIALRDMIVENSDIYPFFLNWNSGPWSSLGEHLTHPILTDEEPNFWISPLAYLTADLGRALTRSPIVLARMGQNDMDATLAALSTTKEGQDSSRVWENDHLRNSVVLYYVLNQRYRDNPEKQIAVSVGDVVVSDGEWARRGAQFAGGLPVKIVTTPLLDALGQGAYEKMLRRAQGMFANSDASRATGKMQSQIEWDLDHGASGAIPIFLDKLAEYLAKHQKEGQPFEITLVAHSMGTIIINRMVGQYPDLPVQHIVFLGAACTIDDFRNSVIPYMKTHPQTDFYNLSLHPTAEALDDEATDLVTRGSLLVWIDKFLDEPQTPLNRTMGQWTNILGATYIFPPELRNRVTLKAFAMVDPGKITRDLPQVHSALSKVRFWDPALWKADKPREEDDPLIQRAKGILAAELKKQHAKARGE